MCGIVGYVGWREAQPILLGGLERLDGHVIAVATAGDVRVAKLADDVI